MNDDGELTKDNIIRRQNGNRGSAFSSIYKKNLFRIYHASPTFL